VKRKAERSCGGKNRRTRAGDGRNSETVAYLGNEKADMERFGQAWETEMHATLGKNGGWRGKRK